MMESFLKQANICNIPDKDSFVYKDECVYCFNTLESTDGLFICMKTFIGVCQNHLELFYNKSNNRLFLNHKIEKRLQISKGEPLGDESEYKKLLKESFSQNKFEIKEFYRLFLMPTGEDINLPAELPMQVQMSISEIMNADCIAKASQRGIKAEKWDGTYLSESKHAATLKQLDNNVKINPSGWKCSECDLTTNLWLNLTDGKILCGRKFFDGSGGNNHAIDHYHKTSYPLAVKLGTITPKHADVFSYEENDMVIDPILGEHLAHFGIDIMKMQKTDKSVEEIEFENIKRNREQIAIIESESNLDQLYGMRFTGIINTGNSCYINSIMQMLFTIPAFSSFYADRYKLIITQDSVFNDVRDFRVQIAKLGYFLRNNADYSYPIKQAEKDGELIIPNPGITPQLFRVIIGENHSDFSTKQQQDAYEFLIHVMELVNKDFNRHHDENLRNPLESVKFRIEDRIFCQTTQTVKYQYSDELVLSLPIAMDEILNSDEICAHEATLRNTGVSDDAVKPVISFQSCLKKFIEDKVIIDYKVNGQSGIAHHSSKLESFPDYLWIQLKRFTVGSDWTPKKLDVHINVPDNIDLSSLRATGLQPGERPMPDEELNDTPILQTGPPDLNQDFLDQLIGMGFPENACRKAVYYTRNASLDEAANWLMVHIGEDDFDQLPIELQVPASTRVTESGYVVNDLAMPDEADVVMMMSMGFTRVQAVRALRETNSLERAADWAFNHWDELQLDRDELTPSGANTDSAIGTPNARPPMVDGPGKYSLVGLISHIGTNAHAGHYVCHSRQFDGSWALFNDDRVQKSINPPKQFAYLYLYKRD